MFALSFSLLNSYPFTLFYLKKVTGFIYMGRAGKVFLLAVIMLGIVWFLFVGIIAEHSSKARKKAGPYSSAKFVEHWKSIERERRFRHQEMDFHVVSKRRIPNGPNPIHNRRASKTKQQPGRVQDLRVR